MLSCARVRRSWLEPRGEVGSPRGVEADKFPTPRGFAQARRGPGESTAKQQRGILVALLEPGVETSGSRWNYGKRWKEGETCGNKRKQVETSGNKWKQVETDVRKNCATKFKNPDHAVDQLFHNQVLDFSLVDVNQERFAVGPVDFQDDRVLQAAFVLRGHGSIPQIPPLRVRVVVRGHGAIGGGRPRFV